MNATKKSATNAWLKGALSDKGHTQHDVAVAWGCDDAVVSRFIATGTPELTWDRALALSRLLDKTLEELKIRLAGGIAPGRTRMPNSVSAPAGSREQILSELKNAVERARAALPDARIEVTVSHGEEK